MLRLSLWISLPLLFILYASPFCKKKLFAQINISNIPPHSIPISDGWGSWKSLHTKHFTIHFPTGRRGYAIQAAQLFEKVHKRLGVLYTKPWYKYKTNVSLVFSSDITQGFATTVGINQIVLYLEAPQLGTFSYYENWLDLLFTHEYTHILSLQIWDPKRYLLFLGRVLFGLPPNLYSPAFLTEGVAVWEESLSGLGRLKDTLTNMAVRTAILSNSYPSLSEMVNTTHRWPRGAIPYLYGGRFIAEFAQQNGKQAPRDYWGIDSMLNIQHRFNALDASYREIYKAMYEKDVEQYQNKNTLLKKKGLTPYKRLTYDGNTKSFLVHDREDKLLFFGNPPNHSSGVYQIHLKDLTRNPILVRKQITNRGIALAGRRRIYSSDYLLYPNFGIRQELHDGNRSHLFGRMAPNRSISYPSLSSSGKKIYFIEKENNFRVLKFASIKNGSLYDEKKIFRTSYQGILQFTALSRNGRYLATVYRDGTKGSAGIVICSIVRGDIKDCKLRLRAKKSVLTQISFSYDDRKLLFSSDANGIYNIYSFHIKKNSIRRNTRTNTGLFYPIGAKESLYAIAYFKTGYDVIQISHKDKIAKRADRLFLKQNISVIFSQKIGIQKIRRDVKGEIETNIESNRMQYAESHYNPLSNFSPYYTGLFDFGKVGAISNFLYAGGSIEMRDPLHWHILGSSLSLFSQNNADEKSEENDSIDNSQVLSGSAYYIYNRYQFGLSLSHRRDGLREKTISEKNSGYLTYIRPGRFISFQNLLGYTSQEHIFTIKNPSKSSSGGAGQVTQNNDVNLNEELSLAGPSVILLLGDIHLFPESISPEKGWDIFVKGEYYKQNLLGQTSMDDESSAAIGVDYGVVEWSTSLYLPSFWNNHVNFLGVSSYQYFGKNVKLRHNFHGSLIRNADKSIFKGGTFTVYSYEYRFPLLWYSRSLVNDWHSFFLRNITLTPFYEYGVTKNLQNERRDTWAYGLQIGIGLNVFYIPFPKIILSISQGKEGGGLFAFGFFSGIGGTSANGKNSSPYGNRITEPYRHFSYQQRFLNYFPNSFQN